MNILLIRGLARERRHWAHFIEEASKAFPKANIISCDIPGAGIHHQRISPSSFDEMISFMREECISKLVPGKTLVLALSLGGMLAKRWSELHPDDFQYMILLNSSFKGINPLHHRLRPQAWTYFLRLFFTFSVRKREKLILKLVSNKEQTELKEQLNLWESIQKTSPVSRVSFINQIRAALSFTPDTTRPETKRLILAAKADRLCSYKCSEKIAKKWDSPIEYHPSAGHDVPIDDSQWLIDKINSFFYSPGSIHS
ncbi:MAG: alpha/beta hydrolase [Bacteriovoracaceae bacterium]|nr:alpha/beta hydrolase [Bacteriovoracaceae bacterium]